MLYVGHMPARISSRRGFLQGTAGTAALAATPASSQTPAQPSATPKLALEDFQPRSMLVVPEHPIERARYPVIDVHTHVSSVLSRDKAQGHARIAEIVAWMDRINVHTMINLTGGYGERLAHNVADL